jgi:hypothetical protein
MLTMRKTALAVALGTFLITATGIMLFNVATANPTWINTDFPSEPDRIPPTIILHSPFQNQTFNSTNIPVNFTVAKPETWFKSSNLDGTWVLGNITAVSYKVDGGENHSLPVLDTSTYFTIVTLPRTLNFSLSLTLPKGAHNITVRVEAESYYVTPGYLAGPPFSTTVHGESELVNFTVVQPEPETEPYPIAPVATVSVITVAVVGVGLLVYFKKRAR